MSRFEGITAWTIKFFDSEDEVFYRDFNGTYEEAEQSAKQERGDIESYTIYSR